MVTRILPHEFRAKARSEGPSGNRALLERMKSFMRLPVRGSPHQVRVFLPGSGTDGAAVAKHATQVVRHRTSTDGAHLGGSGKPTL